MIKRTKLPTMETRAYAETMGALKKGIDNKYLVALIGPSGSGKSCLLEDFSKEYTNARFINCSPGMTMRGLLSDIANVLRTNVSGDIYIAQKQLTNHLISNSDQVLLFDECENLHRGNVSKIDVIRQIYDGADISMVLCGTYDLENVLSGANKHNQPQIFRRIFRVEQKSATKEEFTKYLNLLEELFVARFTPEAKNELFAICTDMDNGGIGVFTRLLEIVFMFTRNEWEEICYNYKNGIKTDTSNLTPITIDKDILKYSSRFQMRK